jgi:hypothetical protein
MQQMRIRNYKKSSEKAQSSKRKAQNTKPMEQEGKQLHEHCLLAKHPENMSPRCHDEEWMEIEVSTVPL